MNYSAHTTFYLIGLAIGTFLNPARADEPGLSLRSGPAAVPLIELYTSEGCSSCPPAEKWLGQLKDSSDLWSSFVPVAFHVDYWDRLGWADSFARPEFTRRQYAYAARWGTRSVYTPAFVYAGREWRDRAERPVLAPVGELTLVAVGDVYRIRFAPIEPDSYEAHVALLAGGLVSDVRRGENSGRKFTHEFVVMDLQKASLMRTAEGGEHEASLPVAALHRLADVVAPRRALAVWITREGETAPLQATGGWLP
jgi:hypothetical protein